MSTPSLCASLAGVPEERRGRPGTERDAALVAAQANPEHRAEWLLIAACASLAGGEPRAALELLDRIGAPADLAGARRLRAVRAWAQNLDRNLYPGGVGGEIPPSSPYEVVLAQEITPGDLDTVFLEACAAIGPSMVLTFRNIVVSAARNTPGALAGFLSRFGPSLEQFTRIANACDAHGAACWAIAARADLQHLAQEDSTARKTLAELRAYLDGAGDAVGVANTWMLEGDWAATPHAWPETLGFVLDGDGAVQSPGFGDDAAALEAYARAAQALAHADAPVATGALALRLAMVAGRAGEHAAQAKHLAIAAQAFERAGDTASAHLVTVHRWLANLARGELRAMRVLAPLEWVSSAGAAAEIVEWARTRGSVTFATGLGRLLHRSGQRWMHEGDYERAELAYRLARPLISVNGAVREWTIPTALAQLDEMRGFPARTVARRLFILHTLPPPRSPAESGVAWVQDIELCMGLVGVPGGLTGAGPMAVRVIDRAVARLRTDLEVAGLAAAGAGPLPRDAQAALDASRQSFTAELLEQLGGHAPQSDAPAESELILRRTAAQIVADVQGRAHPLSALLRARLAERAGADSEAAILFHAAFAYAASVGAESLWLRVLTLAVSGREAEARELLGAEGEGMDPGMRASLSLRARDFATAAAIFRELDAARPPGPHAWIDWTDRAEAAMGAGDLDTAINAATRAMNAFERMLGAVAHDADRLAVADNINAAAIYLVAATTLLRMSARRAGQGDADGAANARAAAFEMAERHRALTLPPLVQGAADPRREQAATEYATAYQRLLAALALEQGDVVALADAVGAAEHILAQIEAAPAASTSTAAGCQRPVTTLADVQRALPPGTTLLAYQALGRDYIAYAVTATALDAREGRVQGTSLEGLVSRLVRACAAGDASVEAATLADRLLTPFVRLIDASDRVIVVPTGALNVVPFHVLPLHGEPLGATHAVSYLPAASLLVGVAPDRPLAEGTALVVGDPAFDQAAHPGLRRLEGAGVEARAVAALYPGRAYFPGAAADEKALRPALRGRALLHIAAHGRLDDIAPNTSSLVLAGCDELTVSDLIGLHLDADLAVLSACDTGRGTTTLGGDLVGLARGLLAAGVRRCIVSLWPVDDVAACVTMVAFHERLRQGEPPARALFAAQREVRALTGAGIVDRYRALGGTVGEGARAVRRQGVPAKHQLAAFPESDDAYDDGSLAAQEGARASVWAPFVLIGV